MAGQPVLRELTEWIAKQGGDGFVLDQIADGVSIGKVAGGIVLPRHGGISRPLLYKWRDQREDRVKGWKLAVKASAEAYAEKAGDVLEDLPDDPTSAQVSKAKSISEYSRWAAGVRDRDTFGSADSKVKLEVDFGETLAGLLRAGRGSMDRHRAPSREIEVAEVEVLPESADCNVAEICTQDTPIHSDRT